MGRAGVMRNRGVALQLLMRIPKFFLTHHSPLLVCAPALRRRDAKLPDLPVTKKVAVGRAFSLSIPGVDGGVKAADILDALDALPA
jgi:hypothetical protein